MTKSSQTNRKKSDLTLPWNFQVKPPASQSDPQTLEEYFAFLEELNPELREAEKKAIYKKLFRLD